MKLMPYLLNTTVVGTPRVMHIPSRSYYKDQVNAPDMRWLKEVTWND